MQHNYTTSFSISGKVWKQLFLCFSLSLLFYSAIIHFSQTTTTLTRNGLYKMQDVKRYMADHQAANILPANLLYAPLIEAAAFLLPATELYLVAAYVNAFFAALAMCAWLLVLRMAGIRKWGLGLLLLYQALNGLFFWLAISSEDITPSFACWLLSFVLLMFWNRNKTVWLWLAVNVLLHFSWLFHWTFMVAAVPVLVLCGFILVLKSEKPLQWIGISAAFFIVLCCTLSLLTDRSIVSILYPDKAQGTLWVGWFSEKIVRALFYGFANQLFGGITLPGSDWKDWIFQPVSFWLPVMFGVFFCWSAINTLKLVRSNQTSTEVKLFFMFGLLSFLLGQAVNTYEQGNDPQFLIQPMFTASVFFCGAFLYAKRLKLWYAAIILFMAVSTLFSTFIMNRNWKEDEICLRQLDKAEKQFGTSANWLYIIAGNDIISSWMSYRHPSDSLDVLFLPLQNTELSKMSPQQYYLYIENIIQRAESSGKKIITNGLLQADHVAIGQQFVGYDLSRHQLYLQERLSASHTVNGEVSFMQQKVSYQWLKRSNNSYNTDLTLSQANVTQKDLHQQNSEPQDNRQRLD